VKTLSSGGLFGIDSVSRKSTKYRRIILKISGEILGDKAGNFDPQVFSYLASEIFSIHKLGIRIGVVIGGGNIMRGGFTHWLNRIDADLCGMVATIINGIVLYSQLKKKGIEAYLRSNLEVKGVVERFNKLSDRELYDKGAVMIFVGGTGSPLFTTDTAAAIKASELDVDLLIKGTKVEGVFSDDPLKVKGAKFYRHINFKDVIEKNLKIMDTSAFNICKEANIPICVFNLMKYPLKKVVLGERIGTIID